jgi:hypothetical protein
MSAHSSFVPDPGWPTIVELAIERWGPPNRKLSKPDDIRFGEKGSKSVKPSDNTWFDHEANVGDGYVEMHHATRGELPKPKQKTNGNGQLPPWQDIATTYPYHNAAGDLILEVVRTLSGSPRFRQRQPLGGDRWKWSVKHIPNHDKLLYRLPELRGVLFDDVVWICEGEKDADRLHNAGLTATTNIGGAGKWRDEYAEEFRGKHCVVLQDNDDAGRAHTPIVARSLVGVAASVKVLLPPGLPPKGDVSDWLDAGHTIDELQQQAREAPDYQPQHDPEPQADKTKRRAPRTINILALVTHINDTAVWSGVLRFNLLTENYEICPPFPPQEGAKGPPRPLNDPHDILLATMYFQANGFAKAGKGVVWDAIAAVAHEHSYHPVRDYLTGLHWDAVDRVSSLFQRYFNAELPDDPDARDRQVAYLEHISIGCMVGAVARVMVPGIKHDHVPVVVGRQQGMLKSTAIRTLCPDPAWFTDNISPDLIDRDTKESLRGKWIIELAEIPHIRRETERVKVFFSAQEDRYRAAYGKATQDHPRQSVFIGSSNDLEFVDVTGNRRFWPFLSVGTIDIAAIEADRDQLWAEALALYRQGVRWWLPPNIEIIAAEQQAGFVEDDIWEGPIAKWLNEHPGPFTLEDLFAKDTGITPYRETTAVSKRDEMRAARCLTKLKLIKCQQTINGRRGVWWTRI